MKRLLLYIICAVTALASSATTYSVADVPNVHVQDRTRFVSNPDGILSPEAEVSINSLLADLNRETTAEFAVVIVDDIDSDIDEFATSLFRQWGLGKKDTNNGLLMLVAKDSRKVAFRTGGGLEGLLPDGFLGSLIRNEIRPRFREEDYAGGVRSAVLNISDVLRNPEAREEVYSRFANDSSGEDPDLFGFYLSLCALMSAAALGLLCLQLFRSRKSDRYDRYQAVNKIYPTVLFLSFLSLGMALVALVPLLIIRHRLRRGPHYCPKCHTRMRLMDEQRDNDFLTHAQDLEEQIGSIDYDVWVCPADGETEIIPYLQRSSAYRECPVCHAHTYHVVSDRIVLHPTTRSEGIRRITSRCLNCGHEDDESRKIPRKVQPVVVVPSSGFGGGGGGGISGGSFGGGFTAGGGASGGW